MVPMPSKTRTAVTIGAVLLVAIVGAVWLLIGMRGTHAAPQEPADAALYEEQTEPVTPATTTPPATAPTTPPDSSVSAAPSESKTERLIPATYTIKPDETLEVISEHFYGDKRYYGIIERFNAEKITNPDVVRAGMTIALPTWEDVFPAAKETAATTPTNGQSQTALPVDSLTPDLR